MLFYLIMIDGAGAVPEPAAEFDGRMANCLRSSVQGAVNVGVVFLYKFVLDQLTVKRNAGQ